jgi:hypothetical protein
MDRERVRERELCVYGEREMIKQTSIWEIDTRDRNGKRSGHSPMEGVIGR